jgi:hypothetical protein
METRVVTPSLPDQQEESEVADFLAYAVLACIALYMLTRITAGVCIYFEDKLRARWRRKRRAERVHRR